MPALSQNTLLFGLLNALVLVSAGWCARQWIVAGGGAVGGIGRDAHRRRIVAATLVAGVLATVACAVLLRPGDIPSDWFTPLQEGNSMETLSALHGRNAHAGSNFRAVQELIAGRSALRAGDVMRANLWLSVMAALLFAAIAQAILRRGWAVAAFTLVFASPV